jgi:hypothetical protein
MLGTILSLRYRQAGRIVTLFDAAERSERRGHAAISSADRNLLNLLSELNLVDEVRWSETSAIGNRFGALGGGRARILESLRERARALDVDIRAGTTVTEVRAEHSAFTVHSEAETSEFNQVVLAVPGPVAAQLTPELPDHERNALRGMHYVGIVTVSFVLDRRVGGRYLSRVTRGGDTFTVLDPSTLEPGGEARTVLYVSRPLANTDDLFWSDDRQIIEHFARALPGNARIVNARVIRTPHAFAAMRQAPFSNSVPGLSIVHAGNMPSGRNYFDRTAALATSAFRTLCAERIS